MASVYNIGDFVSVEEQMYVINNIIQTPMGFNRYEVVNIDTGTSMQVAKHQLSTILVEDIEELTCEWTENLLPDASDKTVAEKVVHVDNNNGSNICRHATLSEDEIDSIAQQRLAQNTEQQTRWAVSLLKGNITLCFV